MTTANNADAAQSHQYIPSQQEIARIVTEDKQEQPESKSEPTTQRNDGNDDEDEDSRYLL